MLAHLGNAGTWLRQTRGRIWRTIAPPAGQQYALWDCSWLLLVLGLIGYVLTSPYSNTTQALSAAPLRFITEMQLGLIITLAAILGIVCSYFGGLALRIGYVAVITACWVMSLNFVIGYLTTDVSIRVLISATIYGWIASRLIRENAA